MDDKDNPRTDIPPANDPAVEPARRRLLTYAILGAGALTLLATVSAHGRFRRAAAPAATPAAPQPHTAAAPLPDRPPPAPPAPRARPRVELVFALDTTGSMSGLIEAAKRKIWSLASFVAQGQPTPELRVGLVAYRDVGDAYVTRVFDLDADLDRVYRRLRQLRAEGGGDTPEHVARALHEAVRKMTWSHAQEVVKVIYLVGDAPPHTDYHDGYDYLRAARAAADRGIKLHTIQCGSDDGARSAWRKVASLGGGEYMAIEQDGGVRDDHSRYDTELARLHDRLAETTLAYGPDRARVEAERRDAEGAPAAVKAARATFMARNGKSIAGKGDLVESLSNGEVKLKDVQRDLPEAMQRMPLGEQAALIASKLQERRDISRRIDELGRLRKAELERREEAAARAGARDGFDVAAKKALKKTVADNPLSGLAF